MALGARLVTSDMPRFKPEVRKLLALARVLEWNIRWAGTTKHMVVMRSPVTDSKTINLPTTSLNQNRWRSTYRQIITHSDLSRLRNVILGGYDLVKEPDIAELVVAIGPDVMESIAEEMGLNVPANTPTIAATSAERASRREPDKVSGNQTAVAAAMSDAEVAAANAQAEKDRKAGLTVVGVPEEKKRTRKKAEPEPVVEPKHVASVRPWLARKGQDRKGEGGKVYESKGVDIITFTDGSETYRCRFCGEFTSDNPRSVKMHAAQKHPQNKQAPPAPVLHTDHYEPSGIKQPVRSAIARLRNDLIAALDGVEAWQALDAPELADRLAHHVYESKPERHQTMEPLTAEQTLARITALVDGGRIADLHHQVENLAAELASANRRAERYSGDLSALQEMIANLGREEE